MTSVIGAPLNFWSCCVLPCAFAAHCLAGGRPFSLVLGRTTPGQSACGLFLVGGSWRAIARIALGLQDCLLEDMQRLAPQAKIGDDQPSI